MGDSFYEKICETDILSPVAEALGRKVFSFDKDYRIPLKRQRPADRLWLNSAHCGVRDCGIWMDVYFKFYKLIPRGCRCCWKLALKVETVGEALEIHRLQAGMGLPAKVGPEVRGYTGWSGKFHAFWYCPLDGGLKGAREQWELVGEKLTTLLGPEHCLHLKRGCTEMEYLAIQAGLGASDQWDKMSGIFDSLEGMLEELFYVTESSADLAAVKLPWYVYNKIVRTWIEKAFENGEETYLTYTNGKVLAPKALAYEKSIHSWRDFPAFEIEKEGEGNGKDNDRFADAKDCGRGESGPKITLL